MLSAKERQALHAAIDKASRQALVGAKVARPGHPSRFGFIKTQASVGREIIRPTLAHYDNLPPSKPRILRALHG